MRATFMQKWHRIGGKEHHVDRTCPDLLETPHDELQEGDGGLPVCSLCQARVSNQRQHEDHNIKRRGFNRPQ
jgi:hypothetical protein